MDLLTQLVNDFAPSSFAMRCNSALFISYIDPAKTTLKPYQGWLLFHSFEYIIVDDGPVVVSGIIDDVEGAVVAETVAGEATIAPTCVAVVAVAAIFVVSGIIGADVDAGGDVCLTAGSFIGGVEGEATVAIIEQ